MSTTVFGIKIKLDDMDAPSGTDSGVGLFEIKSALTADAAADQKDVVVADGSIFTAGEKVYIYSTGGAEYNVIDSIVGNTLTMVTNLSDSFTTANSAEVREGSEFRWIQNDVTGVSDWSSAMLVKEGISKWKRSFDPRYCGGVEQQGSCNIRIKNTNKFHNFLENRSIYLNGRIASIYEFSGSTATRKEMFTCEHPRWDSRTYEIPLKKHSYSRNVFIGTEITRSLYEHAPNDSIGNMIPITLGEIKPTFDKYNNALYSGYAQSIKTERREEYLLTTELFELVMGTDPGADVSVREYPVTVKGSSSHIWYLRLSVNAVVTTDSTYIPADNDDQLYLKVIKDASSDNQNQYRKITRIDTYAANTKGVWVTLESVFPSDFSLASTIPAWVSVVRIKDKRQFDEWPCATPLTISGGAATYGLELFTYSDDGTVAIDELSTPANVVRRDDAFNKVPSFVFTDDNSGNYNTIQAESGFYDRDIDTITGFVIEPVASLALLQTDDLSAWRIAASDLVNLNDYQAYDLYGGTYYGIGDFIFLNRSHTDLSQGHDKSPSTYGLYESQVINVTGQSSVINAFKFTLPEIPNNFVFDDVYIGIHMEVTCNQDTTDSEILIRGRRFLGEAFDILDTSEGQALSIDQSTVTLRNIPDFYYNNSVDTQSLYFYRPSATSAAIYGYVKLPISEANSVEAYRAIYECAILCRVNCSVTTFTLSTKIYELAVIFKQRRSIKEVYMPIQGRIFDDQWGGRKGVADLIQQPQDVIEHVCRLKNWSECSPVPSLGWGKAYANKVRIRTTGEGGFDTIYNSGFKVSGQIKNAQDAYAIKLIDRLCKEFGLLSYVDANGNECLRVLNTQTTSPATTITLNDVFDRSMIQVEEIDPSDIFSEPTVRYNKNQATDDFESVIKITRTDAATYSSAYVEGISGSTTAQYYWEQCQSIAKKSRNIEVPSSDLTDLHYIAGYNAENVAIAYLENWINWMQSPRISFPVHYNLINDWELGKRFNLQLPHHTNNNSYECILYGIEINPNPPYDVIIEAIMLRSTLDEFLIQKVLDAGATNWQKTFDSNDTNIQKVI